ncbi:hypothetical protein [Embleya sp. NBC_00896]|uniref:hypothetical protein n=1 Tax=Embleya sp. NBC_00896 TaxID=2975961 RepID=UPI0038657360|nr:hypothetical protein OG928_10215 [Embleya sp. NBC_00896]
MAHQPGGGGGAGGGAPHQAVNKGANAPHGGSHELAATGTGELIGWLAGGGAVLLALGALVIIYLRKTRTLELETGGSHDHA